MSDLERLAQALALNWSNNYGQLGSDEFLANEAARAEIVAEARELDMYEAVYSRANTIMHGN